MLVAAAFVGDLLLAFLNRSSGRIEGGIAALVLPG